MLGHTDEKVRRLTEVIDFIVLFADEMYKTGVSNASLCFHLRAALVHLRHISVL